MKLFNIIDHIIIIIIKKYNFGSYLHVHCITYVHINKNPIEYVYSVYRTVYVPSPIQ